ncbi:protein NRT1/ PTR FAMILY 2.6-like [Coffea eugenioides]|uniref:protein NRT1/ PTR FAMILY 2.6-like n=1 Tax=Coffea eugenioides TaxID=49369 RepID=UPI000F60D6BB|nr:protein NRT1/ PTR FAMILY 2.6-like [Coffea eugenioides]
MDRIPSSAEGEAQLPTCNRRQGGWITFPFFIATMGSLMLAGGGWMSNLVVYLIDKFNIKSIDATQIINVINGSTSLFPVVGAILADSFLGCYTVIWISAFVSLLGIILLVLTATVDSMKPQPCHLNASSFCTPPSTLQYAVLYTALTLGCIGAWGTRFTLGTMGADQFTKPREQGVYFNWYFFTMYTSAVTASTAIVLVEDSVSWAWGFGICVVANILGLALFLVGSPFYRYVKPEGSPFTALARVIVATIRKWKGPLSPNSDDYYYGPGGEFRTELATPAESLRFLNRAALRSEGDINPDGSIAKIWNLCTIQEVEDLKSLIRIFPLWSSSIFLSTPIGIQLSLTTLQALIVDRHLGPHFQVPVGSVLVVALISTSICLSFFDKFLWPTWKKLIGRPPKPLQRIGVGHVLNISAMAISAMVEAKRLKMAKSHQNMSVLWLMPQLVMVGVGEAFHFPGQVGFYYQEFPTSLKTISTAMVSLLIAVAFYLSTALIHSVRKTTGWLPDNINNGRLDYVYWMLVVIGVLNFGYYILCARLYKHPRAETQEDDNSVGSPK